MEHIPPGFQLFPDFIDSKTEEELINEIDAQVWIVDFQRRLQYYGFRNELEAPYNLVEFPVPVPPLIHELSEKIVERKILLNQPDQVIINEYYPGQGIKPHKDRNYFENQICGVNLGSGCVMKFLKMNGGDVIDIEVPRLSLYVIQDEARYKWKHAIPPRKKDSIDGNIQHRERRLSITYRKVKPDKVKPLDPDGKVAEMLQKSFNIKLQQ